jgi:hypothetical protein
MQDDAHRFRKQADECREQAARRLALSPRIRGSGLPRNGLSWRCQLRTAGSNGLFQGHQQIGLTTVKDYQASIEKLRRDAAEAALIRDLATNPTKREMFDRLHQHLTLLADEVERAMKSDKPE